MKTILTLVVLSQLALVAPIAPIHDGREPIEIHEFPAVEPREPLTFDFKPIPVYVTPKGDWVAQCHEWARQAGISLPPAAISLIDKESDCRPGAQNNSSTAYGIGQFLNSTWGLKYVGCTKTSDPVKQLLCMKKYVDGRHGGWDGAWAYWLAHGSY